MNSTDRRSTLRRFALLLIITLLVVPGVLATPARAQEVPQMEARHTGTTHLFHVTLLVASRGAAQDGGESGLPESVREALDDVRGFLPYDSYRVLDAAMIRSDGHSRVKLRGSDDSHYTAQMTFREAEEGGELVVDRFALVRLDKPEQGGEPLGRGVAPRAPESPLSTSFRIRPGQTVVVGSSRLEGSDKALVVLLTAAP